MTCTRPRSTDRGPPIRHACASSNENASGQKHVFAPLRPRSGASASLTTPLRIRTDGPAQIALHLYRAGLAAGAASSALGGATKDLSASTSVTSTRPALAV